MFYISKKLSDGRFAVLDTNDNVEEFYTESQLREFNVDILGLYDNCIFVVDLPKDIKFKLSNGQIREAVNKSPFYYRFGLIFEQKYENGGSRKSSMSFRRVGENEYIHIYEVGSGVYKTYDKERLISELEWLYENSSLIGVELVE